MKKIILLLLFLLSFCTCAFSQTLSSYDGTVSITVPNYWYRNSTKPTPGVEQKLVVSGNKDTGVIVLRDTNSVLPWNDLVDIPNDTFAAFKDEQIQIIMRKYPTAYIQDVCMTNVFGRNTLAIASKVNLSEIWFNIWNFYFISDNSLYTVIGCGISGTQELIDALEALKTLQIE